ncbi:unnamed protein product [Microthlaspi erraticum]|uniref:F-box domain-containing protein n=1 Tax=Microthlaspi erraticum TaxID=1685480 RepID=A0A6D2L2F2_9BRAS|nr:unnamed protein product [Microthlaspi erraticum]
MATKHRSSVELESLPHDVIELILERPPVKFLLRYKIVCKLWRSTIPSQRFQEAQLLRRRQLQCPDILFASFDQEKPPARTLTLGSSLVCNVKFPTSNTLVCHADCEGMLCMYSYYTPIIIINPATRMQESFPLSKIQE